MVIAQHQKLHQHQIHQQLFHKHKQQSGAKHTKRTWRQIAINLAILNQTSHKIRINIPKIF